VTILLLRTNVDDHWTNNSIMVRSAVFGCFSLKKGTPLCFCCTSLNQHYPNKRSKLNSENGFATCRKLNPHIQDHNNCPAHRSAFLASKELERGLNRSGLMDDHPQQQFPIADEKCQERLECVTATIQTLQTCLFRVTVSHWSVIKIQGSFWHSWNIWKFWFCSVLLLWDSILT
jgi:hypothetical protein